MYTEWTFGRNSTSLASMRNSKRLGTKISEKFSRKWRNWQTRTAQNRMGQPLGVQLSSSAPS